jgi:hypothetical protein
MDVKLLGGGWGGRCHEVHPDHGSGG